MIKNNKFFYRFINSRDEIVFQTTEGYLRNPSAIKKNVAVQFYKEFPNCSEIAYHISLTGISNIFVIDIDSDCLEDSKNNAICLIEFLTKHNWLKPIIKFSGNRGYHLLWKCNFSVSIQEMRKTAEWIGKSSGMQLDLQMYDNKHTIRGINSIHLSTMRYSYLIDENFNTMPYTDDIFNLDNWNVANIVRVPSLIQNQNQNVNKANVPFKIKSKKPECKCLERLPIVSKGNRHYVLFALITDYKNKGMNKQQVLDKILIDNKNFDPPEDENVIQEQIDNVFRRNYRSPSCSWLKDHGLCSIENISDLEVI